MVGLAQVVVHNNPELLLLDEPTSALDPEWQLAVISQSSLIAFGPTKTIISPEVISRLWGVGANQVLLRGQTIRSRLFKTFTRNSRLHYLMKVEIRTPDYVTGDIASLTFLFSALVF
jgi:ABC-type cobalamin/Fe3+-siderophores transport system ATPase subunit